MKHVAATVLAAALCATVASAYEMWAKTDTYACEDREFMEEYKSFVVDLGKDGADKQLALSMVMLAEQTMGQLSNEGAECFLIKEGGTVGVIKSELFAGILTVRKRGSLGRYCALAGFFELK